MEQNKMVEGFNGGNVTNSKGIVAKVVVGALGVAAGIGAVLFLKKKKNAEVECTETDTDVVEDNE